MPVIVPFICGGKKSKVFLLRLAYAKLNYMSGPMCNVCLRALRFSLMESASYRRRKIYICDISEAFSELLLFLAESISPESPL